VVGEHARPRGSWAAPGSTAEALVHAASVPVLLARNPQDHPPGRILVAVDDSDHARLALAWARMLAKMHGARITVSHVFRPIYLNLAKSVSGIDASAALEQKQLDQTREWLDGFVRDAGF